MIKKTVSVLLAAVMLTTLFAGCGKKENVDEVIPVTTGEIGVVRDEEFGNVYIDLTIEEFNNLGFAFGDSIDISFDNGKSFSFRSSIEIPSVKIVLSKIFLNSIL